MENEHKHIILAYLLQCPEMGKNLWTLYICLITPVLNEMSLSNIQNKFQAYVLRQDPRSKCQGHSFLETLRLCTW